MAQGVASEPALCRLKRHHTIKRVHSERIVGDPESDGQSPSGA
jgi:hypothetical protein